MAAHEIYAQQLARLKHGLPLWEPEPAWQDGAVTIGDVGYMIRGRFARLFNAVVPLGDASNALHGVPDGHVPIPLTPADVHQNPHYHSVGVMHTASVETLGVGLKLDAAALQSGVELSFHCAHKAGAVLILKTSATRQDALWPAHFASYLKQNVRGWHQFAVSKGARVELADLLLVTGCDKAGGWAVAAFAEHQRGARIAFEGGYVPVAGGGFSLSGSWSSTSFVQHREGPAPVHADMQPALPPAPSHLATSAATGAPRAAYDQCVFVRGLRCKARPLLAPKVIEAAAEPHDDARQPPEDGEVGELWEEQDDGASECSIEEVGGGDQAPDILDVMLDYILDTLPNCDMAIAHTSDVFGLFEGELPHDLPDALRRLAPQLTVDEDGFGQLLIADKTQQLPVASPETRGEAKTLHQGGGAVHAAKAPGDASPTRSSRPLPLPPTNDTSQPPAPPVVLFRPRMIPPPGSRPLPQPPRQTRRPEGRRPTGPRQRLSHAVFLPLTGGRHPFSIWLGPRS